MDVRLNNLKQDFTHIVDLKNENIKTFGILSDKIKKLKDFYADFIKNNKNNLFMFGLDSFHFQGKLIDIEHDDMHRLFDAIINRMYCEYYKLCKIIVDYIQKNISDKKILELTLMNMNFPVYRDLEPFKKYDFELIQNLHENLLVLLQAIYGYFLNKEHELKSHQMKNSIGLNIDNFVYTFQYNNIVIREKLTLFVTYIEFFHKLHTKYLKRFTTKLQLMFSQITNDIKFEDTVQMNKTRRNSMLLTLQSDNIDGSLMTELQESMDKDNIIELNIDEIPEQKTDMESPLVEPVIEPFVIEEPIIKEPILEAPIVEEPIVEEPIIEEPIIVEEPVLEAPIIVEEPIVEEPVLEAPILEAPIIEEPIIEEPIVEEPIVEESIIEEPVLEVQEEHPIELPMEEPIELPMEEPIIEESIKEEAVIEKTEEWFYLQREDQVIKSEPVEQKKPEPVKPVEQKKPVLAKPVEQKKPVLAKPVEQQKPVPAKPLEQKKPEPAKSIKLTVLAKPVEQKKQEPVKSDNKPPVKK